MKNDDSSTFYRMSVGKKPVPEYNKFYSTTGIRSGYVKNPSDHFNSYCKQDYRCYSSQELSSRDEADEIYETDEEFDVSYDPISINKILTMQLKISVLLDKIEFGLSRMPIPDGDIDFRRRQQRGLEFAIRFSRNYLYSLNRNVVDIQTNLNYMTSKSNFRRNSAKSLAFLMQTLEHKLIASHQLCIQALVAYCKHVSGSVIGEHLDKFKDLLQIIIRLKQACDKICINEWFASNDAEIIQAGEDVYQKCTNMLSKLEVYPRHDEYQSKNYQLRLTPIHKPTVPHKMYQCSNRLGMYGSQPPTKKCFRKTNRGLSTRHSATYRLVNPNQSKRNHLVEGNDSNDANYIVEKKQCEDQIEAILNETKIGGNSKSLKNVVSDEELSKLVPVIADLMSIVDEQSDRKNKHGHTNLLKILSTLLQKYHSTNPNTTRQKNVSDKNWKESQSGSNNMRLICISSTDDASTESLTFERTKNDEKQQFTILPKMQAPISLVLPENVKLDFLQYRQEFENYSQTNAMYSSSRQTKTWDIVAWISDKLIYNLIVDISKELQMDEILKKLFDLEFQRH